MAFVPAIIHAERARVRLVISRDRGLRRIVTTSRKSLGVGLDETQPKAAGSKPALRPSGQSAEPPTRPGAGLQLFAPNAYISDLFGGISGPELEVRLSQNKFEYKFLSTLKI